MYTVSYTQAARSFSQNSVLLYTSTRLEYETRKVCILFEYSSDIAQPKDGHVSRTPPSPRPHSSSIHSSRPAWRWYGHKQSPYRLCLPRPRTGIEEEASQLSRVASPK